MINKATMLENQPDCIHLSETRSQRTDVSNPKTIVTSYLSQVFQCPKICCHFSKPAKKTPLRVVLRSGLTLDVATGVLSGTPTELQVRPQIYRITATNAGQMDGMDDVAPEVKCVI